MLNLYTWGAFGRPAFSFICAVICVSLVHGQYVPFDFEEPVQVSDDTTTANYRMSRNPNTQLAFDSTGRLHLVYWSGYFSTNPINPSEIFHRHWTPADDWSDEVTVDDSYDNQQRRMGGRHPSLAIDKNDTVWVAWHDHRHSPPEPPYNGINNLEVYADKRPADGEFSAHDIRITNTSASHFGDNAYCARVQAAPDGRVSIAWYDFHVDGSISDIFMITSDSAGQFDLTSPMLSLRLTDAGQRSHTPPQVFKPAFNMPDFVITPQGQRHMIWTQDFGGSTGNSGGAPIYYAQPDAQPSLVNYTAIVPSNDGYWNPPKIKLAPNGDIWIAYTVVDNNVRQVELIRRAADTGTFGSPLRLTSGTRNENPDLAIDTDGRLHIVWSEYLGFENKTIRYTYYDPETQEAIVEKTVTTEIASWESPALVLGADGLPYVVFAKYAGEALGDQGSIWFAQPIADQTNVDDWRIY